MLLLNISPKLFFFSFHPPKSFLTRCNYCRYEALQNQACLMYVSLTHFKDKLISSLPLSIPFLSSPPLISDPRVTLPQYFSPFGSSFFLSPRQDACLRLRCCPLLTQSLTHSASSFTFPGQCYMLGEKSVYVTLDLFGLCEALVSVHVCASCVCIF